MYYNSNQNSNDYYSSYKESMQENHKNSSLKKILKLGFIILLLGFFAAMSVFLVNYFSTETRDIPFFSKIKEISEVKTDTLPPKKVADIPKVEITENELPKSIQLRESSSQTMEQIKLNATDTLESESSIESDVKNQVKKISETTNINPKDIALIVEIIMSQMNQTSEETLEQQLETAEEQTTIKQKLKDVNHYNKVVINSKTEGDQNSELVQMKNDLDSILNEPTQSSSKSDYSEAITKEIRVRSNEMRIIVVKRGDTLSKIAQKAYGDKNAYKKIFMANPEVLKNPNEIFVGQKLRIPS